MEPAASPLPRPGAIALAWVWPGGTVTRTPCQEEPLANCADRTTSRASGAGCANETVAVRSANGLTQS